MALLEKDAAPVVTAVALPRVNLLPPEIGERQVLRKVQSGIGLGVLAALGVTALLHLSASSSVAEAQEQVDAQTAQHSVLVQRSNAFRDVTAVYARTAAAEAMLVDAMSEEVRYSRFLDSFSHTLPERVWVTDLVFAQGGSGAAASTSATAGIGTVTIRGTAYGHDDVAVWLETLAAQEGYDAAYLQSATERRLGGRVVVDFETSVVLTAEALSGRYARTGS